MDASFMLEVAAHLATEDIARWEAADVTSKDAFSGKRSFNVWKLCAESEFPELDAEVDLYEGKYRTAFLRCHGLLLRANYELGAMLFIDDIDDVTLLEGHMRKALRFCKSHLARAGRDAHVLLGGFGLNQSHGPTAFRFGFEGRPLLFGLPAGVLELQVCLVGGKLITCAKYGTGYFPYEPCVEASRVQLKLNIVGVHRRMSLCHREVPVTLDGRWRQSSLGMCNGRDVCDGMFGYPDQTVLCVVTLREAEVGITTHGARLVLALNLDANGTTLRL
eukprot:TRINITY_DN10399_c0_g1_i1.p1 TRINITY_DN10399_c0_g1~~TRINITY_DN10399_c0_g1_i1.p1  ORF type:complete len:295 (-),score=28.72 TRINITY_DN10399_c0_g1_i1:286-1113(-)